MSKKYKLVLIAGPSGCGKSYITQRLIDDYDDFAKLPQYTTRDRRVDEDPYEYYFVNKEHYDSIKDKLIAKTEIKGKYYGTVPAFLSDKISIVIVNSNGYKDILDYISKRDDIDFQLVIIDSEIPKPRIDRSIDFLKQEREELSKIEDENTIKYINKRNKFIEASKVRLDIMKKLFPENY